MAYSAEIEEESSEKINSCSSIVRCVLCSRFPLSARLWFFLTLLKYASEHSILIIQSTSPQLFLPPSLARTHTSACREREYYNVLLGFYGRRLRRRHRERREEEEEEKERQHQILRPGFVALTKQHKHTYIVVREALYQNFASKRNMYNQFWEREFACTYTRYLAGWLASHHPTAERGRLVNGKLN